MRTMTILAALAALSLPACGQPGDADETDAAAPAVEAAAQPVSSASAAIEGPRPGLWRVTTRFSGMPEGTPAPVADTCVTGASFGSQDLELPGMRGMDCTQEPFRREGGAIVARSVCTTGERRLVADYRITGDLRSRYEMEIRSTATPAPSPEAGSMTMTISAERLGDCPESAQ